MADYGISIKKSQYNGSPVNKNVTDCTDYELAYSSKFLIPKRVPQDQLTISQFTPGGASGTSPLYTFTVNSTDPSNPSFFYIDTGLAYNPVYEVFIEILPGSGSFQQIDSSHFMPFKVYINSFSTTGQIIVEQIDFSAGVVGVYNIMYYVFYDQVDQNFG